ncbi:hypothetical protein GCM10009616_07220 [Microlunatus lacustris]
MPEPLRCPSCGSPLPHAVPVCPACALPLSGPLAADLWRTDQQLLALQRHRAELIHRLRLGRAGAVQPPVVAPLPPGTAPAPPAVVRVGTGTGWSGQQVLLGVGALLVLTAAVVFLAVAWSAIGVAGQVAVMAVLTAVAATSALVLARRGLTATAETLAVVAVGLAVADLTAAHTLDLAGLGRLDATGYAAGAAALLALACGLCAWRAPTLVAFPLSSALAAGAVPLLSVAAADLTATTVALVFLLATAAAVLAADRLVRRSATRVALRVVAVGYLLLTWAAAAEPVLDDRLLGVGGLTALVAVAACVGAAARAGLGGGLDRVRHPVLGHSALLVAALTLAGLTRPTDPPGLASAALAASAAVTAGLLALTRRPLVPGVGGVVLLGVHLLAAAALALTGFRHLEDDRPGPTLLGGALAGALTLVGVAATLLAGRSARLRSGATGYAAALVLLAAGVAVAPAGRTVSAVVLVVLSAAAAVLAGGRRGHPEEAVLAGAWAVAVVAALGQAARTDEPAVLVASLLAVAGLTCAGYGLLPRRGWAAVLASLLCSAAVWTLLLDRDVATVEAYSLPLAALVGGVGLVRLRRDPSAPSWLTVGPALGVGLLPSAVASVDDPSLTRPLLVLTAGAAVLLLGVRLRWQAALVVGAVALAVVAVSQLAPYAVGLPRWLSFGLVGLLLLVLGARYEQRRRNARQALAWVSGLH